MTEVKSFCIEAEDVVQGSGVFTIDMPSFAICLAKKINEIENDIKRKHKTCQCIPIFAGRYVGEVGRCIKVYCILTF